MRTRADFLRAQRSGIRHSRPGLGIELCPTPGPLVREGAVRVGFTATRRIGNAVARNRAKRRLRAAAAALLPVVGRELHDYVLIARTATLSRAYRALVEDLTKAVEAAHASLDRKRRASQVRPELGETA